MTANCKLVIKIKKITSETNYGSQSEFQNGYTSRQGFQRVCSKQHHTDSQAMMKFLKGTFVWFFSPPHLRTSVLAAYIINMWGNLVQFFLIALPHLPQDQFEKFEMLAYYVV